MIEIVKGVTADGIEVACGDTVFVLHQGIRQGRVSRMTAWGAGAAINVRGRIEEVLVSAQCYSTKEACERAATEKYGTDWNDSHCGTPLTHRD